MANNPTEQWATIEIMGHDQTAGRITFENGFLRVDVPKDDTFRTEYLGLDAIFRVRIVSEEIARAFVPVIIEARPYDAPIITREQHATDMQRARGEINRLHQQVRILEDRLTAINALPEKIREYDDWQNGEADTEF